MKHVKILLLLAATLLSFQFANARPPENATEVMEHLEILGYDVSMNTERVKATHKKHLNVFLKKYRGGILVTAIFGGTEYGKQHLDEFLKIVNQLNADAAAARYYVDKDGDLIVEGYYPGPYRKKNFTTFMEAYNYESTNLADKLEKLKKFIK